MKQNLTARYHVQARAVPVDLSRDGILDPVTKATDDRQMTAPRAYRSTSARPSTSNCARQAST